MTYTIPNTFSPNTTIASAQVNTNFNYIITALNGSLPTNGTGFMTGQFLAANGSLATPSISYVGGPATGFYLAGTNQIGVVNNGSLSVSFNADSSATFNGAINSNNATTLGGTLNLNATAYTFGAGALAAFYAAVAPGAAVGMIIDGGGAAITSGQKGQIYIPFPMTITKWWVMADQSGSISIDVLRANNAIPTASIVGGGTAPNLSSSQFTASAPSSWTSTTLAANDFIAFNVTGTPTNVTRVSITLSGVRTG